MDAEVGRLGLLSLVQQLLLIKNVCFVLEDFDEMASNHAIKENFNVN